MEPYILLVEDNPDDELLMMMALRDSKVTAQVHVARDGAEALDFLGAPNFLPPRVILLDLKLPKVSGLEVLRWIRSHAATKNVPVVVLTSSREEKDMQSSYELGANSYVPKSIDFSEFQGIVETLGRYWMSINQVPGLL